jgi:hypothetical protein
MIFPIIMGDVGMGITAEAWELDNTHFSTNSKQKH